MIRCSGLTKEYPGERRALENVSLEIGKGEFVFLCGDSGAGKSTLLRLLSFEEKPTAGSVVVCGCDSRSIRRRALVRFRRNLGIVFQDLRLLPDRSVFENIAIALRVAGVRERIISQKVTAVLARTGLAGASARLPASLSKGERQRVALARAIVGDPMLLLADEPAASLAPPAAGEILDLLCSINLGGTTVVMAAHDPATAASLPGHRIHLSQGKLVYKASPAPAAGGEESQDFATRIIDV